MRRTELELCHGEKGTMKWNASPWTFLLIVLAKRFILYHVFSPSYIYRGENV